VLLETPATPGARARTLASLDAQSVAVSLCASPAAVDADAQPILIVVLAGVELDATACERAAWFLATHPTVQCVAGSIATVPDPQATLSSASQFVAIRTSVAQALLSPGEPLHSSIVIALAIGVLRVTGRGAGWIADPVIRAEADARTTAPIIADARVALQSLGLQESALIDTAPSGLPLNPQQRLLAVQPPVLDVRIAPATGLRVLVLLQGFPMGGYTAFNADLLPRLAAAGHAITTCTTEWWRSDWRLDQVRAASPDIHHAHAVVPPATVPAYIDWLIASRRIDVVLLSHTLLGLHSLPFLRARHPGVAFVDYVHTDWFEVGMYGSYATMASQWESQLDAQLATSHALVEQLVTQGCAPDAVRAAHIGIDTALWRHNGPRLADVRASLGASAGTLVLLFSGRVSPEKRPHLAVDVTATLLAEGHDVVLVVAGSGPLLQAMHERAVTRGIGARVKILGELNEHTLRHVCAACDVFLAPSEIEGIARSLYEAMAMGCIPVVSDVGGQRELVVPGTGSLVNATRDDAAPYVEGVRPFLHVAARAKASAAARAHVAAHFDSTATVKTVCDTFALARTRRAARQDLLPPAMAEELAVSGVELIRRHVLRSLAR
jgi:glycosyltransferase involved in cell wall biosynthesis